MSSSKTETSYKESGLGVISPLLTGQLWQVPRPHQGTGARGPEVLWAPSGIPKAGPSSNCPPEAIRAQACQRGRTLLFWALPERAGETFLQAPALGHGQAGGPSGSLMFPAVQPSQGTALGRARHWTHMCCGVQGCRWSYLGIPGLPCLWPAAQPAQLCQGSPQRQADAEGECTEARAPGSLGSCLLVGRREQKDKETCD